MKSYVWDWATRLFHWILVILVSISMYTGFVGGFREMDWHMYSGYAILALIIFRIGWGFVGSYNARFTSFIRGPGGIVAYLRNMMSSGPGVGHSPLAALSVIALLLALLVQAVTGLFANDDIFIEGPLVHLVSEDLSNQLTSIHELNRWIVIALLVLHLAAILFYELVKRDRIVLPMITGWKKGVAHDAERDRPVVAIILLAVVAGGVYYLIEYV